MTPTQIDYEVFLRGVDAYSRGEARRAPAGFDADLRMLWIAGWDMEREELAALRRSGATDRPKQGRLRRNPSAVLS